MDRIYRLMKDKKGDELKVMVEAGSHHAEFLRIFRLLEDQSLEELIEANEKMRALENADSDTGDSARADAEAAESAKAAGITTNDLNYRIRKAVKEPKRIFEPHQPYKKPSKKKW